MRCWLLLGALLLQGCSCLTMFDPNSQPCEVAAPAGQQCATGFQCVSTGPDAGVCQRVDAGP